MHLVLGRHSDTEVDEDRIDLLAQYVSMRFKGGIGFNYAIMSGFGDR